MSDILDLTLDALAHLIAGKDQRSGVRWPKSKVSAFDGFEILDPRLDKDGTDYILAGEAADIPVWPMDARWAVAHKPDIITGVGWIFKRVCTLKPAEWRGKLSRVFPKMYEHHECFTDQAGFSHSSVIPYGVSGNRIVDVMANRGLAPMMVRPGDMFGAGERIMDAEQFDIRFSHGIELRREYNWSVLMGEPGIPRARFSTDPIGCRAAFRLRDLPPGKERRAALRHWVSEHWRMKRSLGADDKAWVRAHLRGSMDFTWNGFSCRIEPSRDDLRKAEAPDA